MTTACSRNGHWHQQVSDYTHLVHWNRTFILLNPTPLPKCGNSRRHTICYRCQHGFSRNVFTSSPCSCAICSAGRVVAWAWLLARSRRFSNLPTSRRCWRKQILILLMLNPIGRSRTCLSFPSCLSDLLACSLQNTLRTIICFQILQSNALDWNRSSQSAVWYTAGSGLWQSGDVDTTWSVGRIWQCWPRNITEVAAYVLWSWWTGDQLVRFIPLRSCSTCLHISDQLHTVNGFVWRTSISGRFYFFCTPPSYCSSCLVKRHQLTPHADNTQIYGYCRPVDSAMLTERLNLHRRGLSVDGVQSTTAESRQDRGPVVFIITATVSDSVWSGPTHRCAASLFGPWPWGLHRCRHVYEDPRYCRYQIVFCDSSSYQECAAFSSTVVFDWASESATGRRWRQRVVVQ